MENITKKLLSLTMLLAIVFLFMPGMGSALTYNEITKGQTGKVLAETTVVYQFPSASLINDNGTIYFISGTIKIPFTNYAAFVGLGYSLRNVVNGDLSAYTLAQSYRISTADAEHPWGGWLLYNRTVYYAHETGLIPVPTWNVFLNNGGQSKYIVKANKYDIEMFQANPNILMLENNDARVYSQPGNPAAIISPVANNNPNPSDSPATTTPANPTMDYLKKQALVFQLDQGFGNGMIQNQDWLGLQRVIDNLKVFQTKYEVYAVLSARQSDKAKLDLALDMLVKNNIPFVLEVYASDALTLGKDTVNSPFDASHGRAMSLDQIQQYKNKYGKNFAGLRALEVFGQNYTVLACQKLGVNWCDAYKQYLPTDNFYQKSFLEDYIKLAKNSGMFVLFTDWYWSAYHAWDFDKDTVKQSQNEQELKDLVKAYPNTVVVMYANNEPAEAARTKMASWEQVVKPYADLGAKGFGLSNQSWMCAGETSCPVDELVSWANDAFAKGALVVQTESYWYWWNFPKGLIGLQSSNYTQDSQWADRGYASGNLQVWASKLKLALPSQPIALRNNAVCVNVEAPDYVKPGGDFTGKVTVKNTGTTTWTQNSSTNPNPYRLAAADFKLPPYTSSIWGNPKIELPALEVKPGDTATFTISTKASSTEGSYDFGWQMLEDYKEWFGDACTKKIQVSSKPPAPTNAAAICPSPGNQATVSWTAPSGFDTYFLAIKYWPHPTDGTAIVWNDSFQGASHSFTATPGKTYNWWVFTKDTLTSEYSSEAVGTTFTCPAQ